MQREYCGGGKALRASPRAYSFTITCRGTV